MDGVVALVIGLVGGLILTPVARRVALSLDIVDRPGELKTQRIPIAYLGGIAVAFAAASGPLLADRAVLLIPMGAALTLGLADDLRPLAVPLRVVVELGIAAASAFVVPGPPLARVATGVLVLGLLNAVNLLDGQDGLAAGVGIVISVAFAVLGGGATPVGLGLAGALLGFLVLNRPPARIYLGDAGAYFVGTTIALLPALADHAATRWSIWWAVPLLVAVPVADTAIAILRRLRTHQPLLSGDRSHVYDQLVDRGSTISQSTLICVACQFVLSGIGLVATQAAPTVALLITLATAASVSALAWRSGFIAASGGSGDDHFG